MSKKIRETSNQPTKLERRDRLLLTADLMATHRPIEIHKILEEKGYHITLRQLTYDLRNLQEGMSKEVTQDDLAAKKKQTLSKIQLLWEMALSADDRKELRMLTELEAKVEGVITTGSRTQVNVQNNTLNQVGVDYSKFDKETLRKLKEAGM
jgi:hypothetical protein